MVPPAGQGAVTAATAGPEGAPPPMADVDAWKAAADPLAPPVAPHEHAASETPTVDAASGRLEKHCSACGALVAASREGFAARRAAPGPLLDSGREPSVVDGRRRRATERRRDGGERCRAVGRGRGQEGRGRPYAVSYT